MVDEQELLLREVDEDVRRDKYDEAWRKYGKYIIGTAVSIVLAVSANTFWTSHVANKRAASSDAYVAALTQSLAENVDISAVWTESRASLNEGYIAFSYLQEGAAHYKAGNLDEALVAYTALAKNNNADKRLRDLAQLLAGKIEYQQGNYAQARGRLSTLTSDENSWKYSAQESLAHINIAEGNIAQAIDDLIQLVNDHSAPTVITQRAEDLRQLLEPQVSQDEAETDTADATSDVPGESKE